MISDSCSLMFSYPIVNALQYPETDPSIRWQSFCRDGGECYQIPDSVATQCTVEVSFCVGLRNGTRMSVVYAVAGFRCSGGLISSRKICCHRYSLSPALRLFPNFTCNFSQYSHKCIYEIRHQSTTNATARRCYSSNSSFYTSCTQIVLFPLNLCCDKKMW